jgi:hypothetical protein
MICPFCQHSLIIDEEWDNCFNCNKIHGVKTYFRNGGKIYEIDVLMSKKLYQLVFWHENTLPRLTIWNGDKSLLTLNCFLPITPANVRVKLKTLLKLVSFA